MRFSVLILLGLVFIAYPIASHASDKPIFSSYTCPEAVPCGETSAVSSEQWAAAGNACVTRGFGYTNANGFIDDMAGLDSSNCMTSKSNVLPKGMGAQLTPRCCIVQLSNNNSCAIHCDIVPQ